MQLPINHIFTTAETIYQSNKKINENIHGKHLQTNNSIKLVLIDYQTFRAASKNIF